MFKQCEWLNEPATWVLEGDLLRVTRPGCVFSYKKHNAHRQAGYPGGRVAPGDRARKRAR